jgi:hypothetical protein
MTMVDQQEIDISEPCNNIVAQSDYDAALAAIESTFDNFQLSHRGHEIANSDQPLDTELIEEIYKSAKASLLENVKRAVRPIDDNDYSDYVNQYHIIMEEESDDDDEDVRSVQDLNLGNEESDEEEEEIDVEELVDMKAWNDAQELRTRIRTMSSTVQSVRERVLNLTEDGIMSSISSDLMDKAVEIVFNDDDCNDRKGSDDAFDDKENNAQGMNAPTNTSRTKNNNDCSDLQDSLRDLSKILQHPKWKRLSIRVQSLQDTIETVQKEISDDRVMSQTEIAITSKYIPTVNESSRRKILEQDSKQDESSSNDGTIDAMDRLALFGQLFS